MRKRNFTKVKQRAKTKTQRKLLKIVWRRRSMRKIFWCAHMVVLCARMNIELSAVTYLPALLIFILGCCLSLLPKIIFREQYGYKLFPRVIHCVRRCFYLHMINIGITKIQNNIFVIYHGNGQCSLSMYNVP